MNINQIICTQSHDLESGNLVLMGTDTERVHGVIFRQSSNDTVQIYNIIISGEETGIVEDIITRSAGRPILIFKIDWWVDVDVNSSQIGVAHRIGDVVAYQGNYFLCVNFSGRAYFNLQTFKMEELKPHTDDVVVFNKWSLVYEERRSSLIVAR